MPFLRRALATGATSRASSPPAWRRDWGSSAWPRSMNAWSSPARSISRAAIASSPRSRACISAAAMSASIRRWRCPSRWRCWRAAGWSPRRRSPRHRARALHARRRLRPRRLWQRRRRLYRAGMAGCARRGGRARGLRHAAGLAGCRRRGGRLGRRLRHDGGAARKAMPDLAVREDLWAQGLRLRAGRRDMALRHGARQLRAQRARRTAAHARARQCRAQDRGGPRFARLEPGMPLYLMQKLPILPNRDYRLSFALRAATPTPRSSRSCARMRCSMRGAAQHLRQESAGAWEQVDGTIASHDIARWVRSACCGGRPCSPCSSRRAARPSTSPI